MKYQTWAMVLSYCLWTALIFYYYADFIFVLGTDMFVASTVSEDGDTTTFHLGAISLTHKWVQNQSILAKFAVYLEPEIVFKSWWIETKCSN